MRRLIVGITGASGALYGISILQMLKQHADIESHLIISKSAGLTIEHETNFTLNQVKDLADVVHNPNNIGASIASGSFETLGMIVAPCSIRTLADISTCSSSTLMTRAADVCLKERRPVVLMVRETPFHLGHLRAMASVTEMGAIVMPPVPALYAKPQSVEELIAYSSARALDKFGIKTADMKRWGEDLSLKD